MLNLFLKKILFPDFVAPELNDLDNNSSNLNNNQSNIALFKNDIALGKGLIHKVLYHGLVVLLKIHNHHQAQALQHANTALIYGGISVREDHRLLQRDLRREGWAEFKKQIINLNPEHNNNSKITKTMLDVFIKLKKLNQNDANENQTIRDFIDQSNLYRCIYQDHPERVNALTYEKKVFILTMLSGEYQSLQGGPHATAEEKIRFTALEIKNLIDGKYDINTLSVICMQQQQVRKKTKAMQYFSEFYKENSGVYPNVTDVYTEGFKFSSSTVQYCYVLLMNLILGEIWYLSLRIAPQEPQNTTTHTHNSSSNSMMYLKNSVKNVMHHYLANIKHYFEFEPDYEIEGPTGQKFGDKNFRFNYPFMFIHHINILFKEENQIDAVLKFINDITHPETPTQISCGHGMMLRILDVYGMCVQSQKPQPLSLEHYFASLRNLFSIQTSGDVLLRSLLMRYYDVKIASRERIRYLQYKTSSGDILLEDSKYNWLTDFLYEYAKAYFPHSGELQRLLTRPHKRIHDILVFWENNPFPTFPQNIKQRIESDQALKEHFDKYVLLVSDLTKEKVTLVAPSSPILFDLWHFASFTGRELLYDPYEILYALLIHYQQYYVQSDLPETVLTQQTNIAIKLSEMCQEIYLNEILKDYPELAEYCTRNESITPLKIEHIWPKDSPKLYINSDPLITYAPRSHEKIIAFNDLIFSALYHNPSKRVGIFFSGPICLLSKEQFDKIVIMTSDFYKAFDLAPAHIFFNMLVSNMKIDKSWSDLAIKYQDLILHYALSSHNISILQQPHYVYSVFGGNIRSKKEDYKHIFESIINIEKNIMLDRMIIDFLQYLIRKITLSTVNNKNLKTNVLTLDPDFEKYFFILESFCDVFIYVISLIHNQEIVHQSLKEIFAYISQAMSGFVSHGLDRNNINQGFSNIMLKFLQGVPLHNLECLVNQLLEFTDIPDKSHVLVCLERKLSENLFFRLLDSAVKQLTVEQYIAMIDQAIESLATLYTGQQRQNIFNHFINKLESMEVDPEFLEFKATQIREKFHARHRAFDEELDGAIRKEKRKRSDSVDLENIEHHNMTPPSSPNITFSRKSTDKSPNSRQVMHKKKRPNE